MTDTQKNENASQNAPENEETLAARSARLEAEAAAIIDGATNADRPQDPLAPESEPELYTEAETLDIGDSNIQLITLQKEYEETKDKMIRAVAEAENARKRAIKEREDARKYSISGFSKDIVNVADNLRRALEAIPAELAQENEQVKNLLDGIEATERELLRTFEKNGIQKVETTEGVFNPNLHEVMFEAPGTGQPAGTIIQVLEPGYTLHDRLLRPARVGVAKDEGSAPPPSDTHIDTQV